MKKVRQWLAAVWRLPARALGIKSAPIQRVPEMNTELDMMLRDLIKYVELRDKSAILRTREEIHHLFEERTKANPIPLPKKQAE